jgi:hypothetical protein
MIKPPSTIVNYAEFGNEARLVPIENHEALVKELTTELTLFWTFVEIKKRLEKGEDKEFLFSVLDSICAITELSEEKTKAFREMAAFLRCYGNGGITF